MPGTVTEAAVAETRNMPGPDYWYSKTPVPDRAKEKIGNMVRGTAVGEVGFSGLRKELLKVDGGVFSAVFTENRKYLYRGECTAPSDENDYTDCSSYLTEDGLAGFSVTGTGWLVSLYSNYNERGFARAVRDHIVRDAYKLVCIVSSEEDGSGLVRMYEDLYGFRGYVRTLDDTNVMAEHYGDGFVRRFIAENGTPCHIFMVCRNTAGSTDACPVFEDYFTAKRFVDSTVRKTARTTT